MDDASTTPARPAGWRPAFVVPSPGKGCRGAAADAFPWWGRSWKAIRLRWLGVLLVFGLALEGQAATAVTREYQLKAVFLLNFALFTQWPPTAFESPASPVVIGILGDDPFGRTLDEAVAGESLGERNIVVRRCRTVEEAQECHVVFISTSERGRLARRLVALSARPILTVSDIPAFARRGGIIGFFEEESRLRFEVNVAEAQRNAVQLSSQLLHLARIVE